MSSAGPASIHGTSITEALEDISSELCLIAQILNCRHITTYMFAQTAVI